MFSWPHCSLQVPDIPRLSPRAEILAEPETFIHVDSLSDKTHRIMFALIWKHVCPYIHEDTRTVCMIGRRVICLSRLTCNCVLLVS